jgi:hypothetical protein
MTDLLVEAVGRRMSLRLLQRVEPSDTEQRAAKMKERGQDVGVVSWS